MSSMRGSGLGQLDGPDVANGAHLLGGAQGGSSSASASTSMAQIPLVQCL
jgi:hypothetical protein